MLDLINALVVTPVTALLAPRRSSRRPLSDLEALQHRWHSHPTPVDGCAHCPPTPADPSLFGS